MAKRDSVWGISTDTNWGGLTDGDSSWGGFPDSGWDIVAPGTGWNQ